MGARLKCPKQFGLWQAVRGSSAPWLKSAAGMQNWQCCCSPVTKSADICLCRCVIRGCVPKKLLVYGAQFQDEFSDARGFGWSVGPTAHNWSQLISHKASTGARMHACMQHVAALHAHAAWIPAHL